MLQLMPISENDINKAFFIDIDDLDFFAHTAIMLEAYNSWSAVDGYSEALFEYMQSIKYKNKDLFTKYDKLIHAQRGSELLKYAIELYLLEKDMKKFGINNLLFNKYNSVQTKYINLINELKTGE